MKFFTTEARRHGGTEARRVLFIIFLEKNMLMDEELTRVIIGAAIEVHKALGPGLLESAYEQCLCYELSTRGLKVDRQVGIPVRYKDVTLDVGYRVDVVVEDRVILELKAEKDISPVDRAQLLTYMKLSEKKIGLLLNFHVAVLRDGLVRMVL
jgi:GxxExxY protein